MRVREWYGWHFPELSRIIPENVLFAKIVKRMGIRTNAVHTNFADILPEELLEELKEAAKISMGTEVSDEDIDNIQSLCDQVISISEYREQLFEYLKNRMQAIAPNLAIMVGELVGARLIARAGSLLNLAKHPASTVQILGAEKALFRALKTKHETPKYGLIYHASLIGQAPPKLKGKISRVLAAKTALAVRYDSFGEGETTTDIGLDSRAKVELRLKNLESERTHRVSGATPKKSFQKYDYKTGNGAQVRSPAVSTSATDSKLSKTIKHDSEEQAEEEEKPKKKKKVQELPESNGHDEESTTPKKSKKVKKEETEEPEETPAATKSKSKKRKVEVEETTEETEKPEKKKKKKKASSE